MGSKSSTLKDLGMSHPQRFYDGCVATEDGCYTVAEIYFNQAMARHPGHAFWTSLMDVAIAKAAKPSDTAAATSTQRPPSAEGLPSVLKTETELGTTVFRDGDGAKAGESAVPDSKDAESPHPDANLSLNDPPSPLSGSKSAPTLLFPVDHRLVDLQDYVRMLTDIGRVYRRKAADSTGESQEMSCRLSMLYNAYTAVRLQALLTVLRAHFAAHSTEEDGRGEDMFQLYAKRAMNAQWASAAFKTETQRLKHTTDDGEVNMDAQQGSGQGDTESHSYDEDVLMFWQSVTYFFYMNVICYIHSALRLMSWTDYAMSPATQKAVVDMVSQCCEVIEKDLSVTTGINSHIYVGRVIQKFTALLGDYTQECRAKEDPAAVFGPQRNGKDKKAPRTVKEKEVTFLHLGPASFADQQLTFLRIAMRFPVMTLPLLDVTKVLPVQLEMQQSGSHRPVKLMTPLDRSFGWYMSFSYKNKYERHSEGPGGSVFLQQNCGVVPGATMKDPICFAAAGLEELSLPAILVGCITTITLFAMGRKERSKELAAATDQFALDMYGEPTPLSVAMKAMLDNLEGNAAY